MRWPAQLLNYLNLETWPGKVSTDACKSRAGLQRFLMTYRGGSPNSSLIENFSSGTVSRAAQSKARARSICSSSSTIVGLRTGRCDMHVATTKRTKTKLISPMAWCYCGILSPNLCYRIRSAGGSFKICAEFTHGGGLCVA